MKKLFGLFVFGLFVFELLSFHCLANEPASNAIKSSLVTKSLLLDITNVSEQFLVAVGERGHIIRSVDGENWQQMDVPSTITLTSVTFVNEKLGWAVGHSALILHTKDGGNTWQQQQYLPQLEKPILDIVFKNEKEGIAIGAYGLFFRTSDGGESWKQEFHLSLLSQEDLEYLAELKSEDEQAYLDERGSILPHFNRIFIDGRTMYLVGEVGLIAKSNDFGESWQRFDDIYQGSFFDFARTLRGNLLAVGLRGNAYRSVSNGTPWQKSTTSTTALLNSIVLTASEQLFILGNNGVLLESRDDGHTFTLRNQPDGKALLSGVVFHNKLIVASEVGIKVLQVIK